MARCKTTPERRVGLSKTIDLGAGAYQTMLHPVASSQPMTVLVRMVGNDLEEATSRDWGERTKRWGVLHCRWEPPLWRTRNSMQYCTLRWNIFITSIWLVCLWIINMIFSMLEWLCYCNVSTTPEKEKCWIGSYISVINILIKVYCCYYNNSYVLNLGLKRNFSKYVIYGY